MLEDIMYSYEQFDLEILQAESHYCTLASLGVPKRTQISVRKVQQIPCIINEINDMKNRVSRFNIRKERKRKRVFRRQQRSGGRPSLFLPSLSLLGPKPPIDIRVETTLHFKVTQVGGQCPDS